MITKDNVRQVLAGLKSEDVLNECQHEYVLIEVHIFNVGGFSTIEGSDWNDEVNQYASDNGQLYIDIDTLCQLYDEVNLDNPLDN